MPSVQCGQGVLRGGVSCPRTALEGIEAFRTFLRSIGMPLTFAEIGADPADIPELVEMNHIGGGKTGGYIGLDKQAHFDIYNLAAGNCVSAH